MPGPTVDANGVTTQTYEEILVEVHEALRAPDPDGFGPEFVLEPTEVIPMTVAIWARREASLQAFMLSLVHATVPGAARGVHEDNIAALTGTERLPASSSTIELLLTGTAGETIPTGRVYRHVTTGTLWAQAEDVLLDGGGEGTTIAVAVDTGPIFVGSGEDWEIVIGDPDLESVESTAASEPGRALETDEELEERRKEELARGGQSTPGAIRADVLKALVDAGYAIDSLVVGVNFTKVVDAFGRPASSVEVLLDDNGLIPDEVIVAAIWTAIGGGAEPYGSTVVNHTDEVNGDTYPVGFSRIAQVPIWLRITLDATSSENPPPDPVAASEAVEAAVLAFAQTHHPGGRNVIPIAFIGTVITTLGEDVLTDLTIDVSDDGATWQATPFAIGPRQRATFTALHITSSWV